MNYIIDLEKYINKYIRENKIKTTAQQKKMWLQNLKKEVEWAIEDRIDETCSEE